MIKTFLLLLEEHLWFITAFIHLTIAFITTSLYLFFAIVIRWFERL
jgi:hypothetical protein